MIDVKKTILHTLTNKFDRLRFLGDNDTQVFKKILQLIVLDDLYDWSNYLNDSQAVQKKLKDLRLQFIQCNPEFEICRTPFDGHYVDVNLPQEYVIDINTGGIITGDEIPDITPTTPTTKEECGEPTVVFFTGDLPEPETLTDCQKMNIYINKITGEAYFLNTDVKPNVWVKINSGDIPEIPEDVLSYTNDDEQLKITLNSKEDSVPITDSEDNSNNKDLNDVL